MQDAHAVHPDHPQPQDDGDCRSALRRDHGGAGRFEADFGPVELSAPAAAYVPEEVLDGESVCPASRSLSCSCRWPSPLAGCDMAPWPPDGRATDEWTRTYPLTRGRRNPDRQHQREDRGRGRRRVDGRDPRGADRARRDRRGRARAAAADRDQGRRHARPRVARNRADERHHDRRRLRSAVSRPRAQERRRSTSRTPTARCQLIGLDGKVRGADDQRRRQRQEPRRRRRRAHDQRRRDDRMASVGPDRSRCARPTAASRSRCPRGEGRPLGHLHQRRHQRLGADKLEVSEQSRRRLEGSLNGGGTPIELQTTNGGIRVRPRGAESTRPRRKPDR